MPGHPLNDVISTIIEEDSLKVLRVLSQRPPHVSLGTIGTVAGCLFKMLPTEGRLAAFDRWVEITRDHLR